MFDVNSNVEAGMIPISVMITAPTAVCFQAVNIAINLAAVLAVARAIAINSGTIRLQTPVAVVGPVAIAKRCAAHGQREQYCRAGTKYQANDIRLHESSKVSS
jgi:hypothetical protein